MTAEAHDLVRRLRALQQRRHDLTAVKDRDGAHAALELAVSLIDPRDLTTLREALLHATNPASVPPIPVVLGPQDVAAVVGRGEAMALIRVYATACVDWKPDDPAANQRCVDTYREVEQAVERLCQAVPVFEAYGDGRTS